MNSDEIPPSIWASVWHDPEDDYRPCTLAFIDPGASIEQDNPNLIDCGEIPPGATLAQAQREILFTRANVYNGNARIRYFTDESGRANEL